MDANKDEPRWRKWVVVYGLLSVAAATMILPRLAETTSPVELGLSQPPLVTVIFDTTSSMQWTEGGDGHYPVLNWSSELPTDSSRHLDTWRSGSDLNLPGSRRLNALGEWEDVGSSNHVVTVGPCLVWHPMNNTSNDRCSQYERPPSCDINTSGSCEYNDYYGDGLTGVMESRLQEMRNNPALRLSDDSNTPRHIQVKQILAGEMRMETGTGPGCWFVPRSRGALIDEQVCCDAVNDGTINCDGSQSRNFESFIDYDDPVPHIQEVYRYRLDNGLLQTMASTTIFAAAMFDGLRGDGYDSDGWQYRSTDIVAGSSPYSGGEGDLGWIGAPDCTEDDGGCYDMGMFRWIGPRDLNLNQAQRIAVSSFVQRAILDAGYLQVDEMYQEDSIEAGDDQSDDVPVFRYSLGKQPLAYSSPFGALFHDLHQFYLNGQHQTHSDWSSGSNAINPFADDPYVACRARHAVMFTDGLVEPEAPGGAGNNLGGDRLSPEFGFRPELYPYMVTEHAIHRMLEDTRAAMDVDNEGIDPRFEPRVHILAVGAEETEYDRIRDKVATMAEYGRTCAQYYLPPEMVPVGIQTGYRDSGGTRMNGTCNPSEDICLVPQGGGHGPYGSYLFEPPDGTGGFICEHPALMLNRNDREAMITAFQLIFNEIVGGSGLAARTRPSITNYLDDDEKVGQYRLFSGLHVSGDNLYWKGMINRQLLTCGTDGNVEPDEDLVAYHRDMNRLRFNIGLNDEDLDDIAREDVDSDRRRIFTSVPYFADENFSGSDFSGGTTASNLLSFTYQLLDVDGSSVEANDEMGEFNIVGIDNYFEEDTRVPFNYPALRNAFRFMDDDSFFEYWEIQQPSTPGRTRADVLRDVVDEYRGRIGDKADRVLGGIYNSNPVTVGPPDLDLAIDSYRHFRRAYAERPTMTYVSTVDGQLHALYTGQPSVPARAMDGSQMDNQSVEEQREAWAYIPSFLHARMVRQSGQAPQLMDGSPVVTDVRLCHGNANLNANPRVCPAGDNSTVPFEAQWRTVLVQGMGLLGSGYFAIDVTRTGGPDEVPDPIVLWEFGQQWEMRQLQELDESRYGPENTSNYESDLDLDACRTGIGDWWDGLIGGLLGGGGDEPEPWQLSYLGTTVAEPAVGRVNVDLAGTRVQRAVAVFGAGTSANTSAPVGACTDEITGRAIYVVDLQSGEILRRFIDYDDGSSYSAFPGQITGTPVMSGANPGDLSTRAFIGDENGRMFRIDMTKSDVEDWTVQLFFDPAEHTSDFIDPSDYGATQFGPAAFRPAVTVGLDRQLILIYGLGQRDDSGGDDAVQAVIALRETFSGATGVSTEAEKVWREVFGTHERLTGEPLIFDGDVFFTTYVEPENQCLAGRSRIWRLAYDGVDPNDPDADNYDSVGRWDQFADSGDQDTANFEYDNSDPAPKWYGPLAPRLIRGVALTMGPTCDIFPADATGSVSEPPPSSPQLVTAGTGASGEGGIAPPGGSGAGVGPQPDEPVRLQRPRSSSIPLSWSVIEN